MGRRAVLVILATAAMLAAGATTAAALVSFATPSRNIGCIGDRTGIRCDIRQTTVAPPPRPASCELDWGNAFVLDRTGRGRRICHGDTALPGPGQPVRIVRYGTALRLGTIVCRSRRSGLTCRNAGRHGFLLSRATIRVF